MPTIEEIESLAKRRGFFFQDSEIYGGLGGFFAYGHLGALMKMKLENLWRKYFLDEESFFEIQPSEIMHENVLKASGHLTHFVDPIAKCKKCGTVHRADHIMEDFLKEKFEGLTTEELKKIIKKHNVKCPKCKGELSGISVFNMTFPIDIGAENPIRAYLRPETAQGVYINFLTMFNILRKKLPLGLAIVGKAYRNEISPRQLIIRMREFTQAELQIFFDPDKIDEHEKWDEIKNYKLILYPTIKKLIELTCDEAVKKLKLPRFYVYYMAKVQKFFLEKLQIPKEKFRLKELSEEERAFYNKIHWDIELNLESLGGFKEIGGVHYRTSYDLEGHQKVSKQSIAVTINNKKVIPHVLELSFGIDRMIYSLLDIFYLKEKDRVVLKLPRVTSSFDCGIFPLVNKDGLPEKAKEILKILKEIEFKCFYDDSGSIGRRYRRMDEIGVIGTLTTDYQTLEDNTVTLRDRDSTYQIRISIENLKTILSKFLKGEKLENLGKVIK